MIEVRGVRALGVEHEAVRDKINRREVRL